MSKISSSILSLSPILEFSANNIDGSGMHGISESGRAYGKLVSKLCDSIMDCQGFYAWGFYEKSGLWRTIYVGKAGFGKTASLKARITEELKDERAFVWCGKHTGLNRDDCKKIWQSYYPASTVSKVPENHIERSLRKIYTTHIVWAIVPNLSNDNVRLVEADLIETLNPSANFQRSAPHYGFLDTTIDVIRAFKQRIHDLRM